MGERQIGILGTSSGDQTVLLREALTARGARVHILHPKKLTSSLPDGGTESTSAAGEAVRLENLDALMVRHLPGGSLEQVTYRLNVLHRLERRGLRVMNRTDTLEMTVDKFTTTALLADAGLPVPRTVVTERYDDAMAAARAWGKVVIKPVFGSMGRGIVQADDPELAHRVLRALELGRNIYYMQEYLPHEGTDFRLFVLGGRILGAMRRRSRDWRTNIATGAKAEAYDPPEEHVQLALQAAELLGADYLGVDILESGGKSYLLEANGIPGWLGLQTVMDEDIAGAIADHVLELRSGM